MPLTALILVSTFAGVTFFFFSMHGLLKIKLPAIYVEINGPQIDKIFKKKGNFFDAVTDPSSTFETWTIGVFTLLLVCVMLFMSIAVYRKNKEYVLMYQRSISLLNTGVEGFETAADTSLHRKWFAGNKVVPVPAPPPHTLPAVDVPSGLAKPHSVTENDSSST